MYIDENDTEIVETSDFKSVLFMDGPMKDSNKQVMVLQEDGCEMDFVAPFEVAKWQQDPSRESLFHRYKYLADKDGLFFVKSYHLKVSGFGNIKLNKDNEVESVEEIKTLKVGFGPALIFLL